MTRFRGDVEGLRGIAVLLVVLDHLDVPGFGGGFIGVDVFFVISGYLITSLLAAEYAKKAEARGGRGAISIPGFYCTARAPDPAGGAHRDRGRRRRRRRLAQRAARRTDSARRCLGRSLRVERELHPTGDRLLRAGLRRQLAVPALLVARGGRAVLPRMAGAVSPGRAPHVHSVRPCGGVRELPRPSAPLAPDRSRGRSWRRNMGRWVPTFRRSRARGSSRSAP